jgi:hypothetical protein
MKLPTVGDTVTTKEALELCRHFSLDYLADRIESYPERYKDWKFDGCSCLPDEVLGFFAGCNREDITYKCCLPHDLCYGYGERGDSSENLVNKAGMKKWCASGFLAAVRIGGAQIFGLSFSWGFAHK